MKIEVGMKAKFREIARQIVGNDRSARRMGCSQNTVGAVTSALERAFKDGFEIGMSGQLPSGGHQDNDSLDWIEVPPTSRNVLSSLTLGLSHFASEGEPMPLCGLLRSSGVSGGDRYFQIDTRGVRGDHHISGKGVGPLLRLGLLEENEPGVLTLSAKGIETGRLYWARVKARDTTLPRESMGR